ncbi:MAG: STT3 domain-containing protein [Candidatus Geothermarchaeota archaeon]
MSLGKSLIKIGIPKTLYIRTSVHEALKFVILSMILVIGFFIRVLPAKHGAYITEFDPYLQYYATQVIVDGVKNRGITGLFDFFNHHTTLTWQPEGVDLGKTYYPGVPYAGALTYIILNLLEVQVSLTDICIYLPVFFGLLGTITMYLIGREVGGEFLGFITALFFSISPSVIPRSNLGWYDTDGLGVPLLLLSVYFFILSIKEYAAKRKITYSLLSGLFAGLLSATWGAFMYLYAIYALYSIIIVLLNYVPDRYELSYLPMIMLTTIIANCVPRNGTTYLLSLLTIPQYVAICLVVFHKYVNIEKFLRSSFLRTISLILLGALFIVLLINLTPVGISERYLAAINPFYKEVSRFVQTVQEQSSASYSYFYRGLFILVPFSLYGFYRLLRDRSYINLLLIIFALTGLYSAFNFVRLIVLATPILSIISGIGLQNISTLLYRAALEREYRKVKGEVELTRTVAFVFSLLIILSMLYYGFNLGLSSADYPVTIVTGSAPITSASYDWFQALEYMYANVPSDAIVAAWWDYGYWISFIGQKRTLADNGTMNITRISLLAEMFLSNESKAIEILKSLGAEYVVVYLGTSEIRGQYGMVGYILTGIGEEGKFIQMAKIVGKNPDIYLNRSNTKESIFTEAFWNTFLGKLIPYEFMYKDPNYGIDIYYYSPKYPSVAGSDERLILVFRSEDPGLGEVLIYKVVS